MKCKKCGSEIKEGHMYCEVCGEEIRIVPDFDASVDDGFKVNLADIIDDIPGVRTLADTKELSIEDISETKEIIKKDNSIQNEESKTGSKNKIDLKFVGILVLLCVVSIVAIVAVSYNINQYYSYDIQYEKAFEQFSNGEYDDSVKTLKHVIKLNDTEVLPKLLLCDNYYELGKYDEALAVLETLLTKYQGDMNIYERLVKNYTMKGDNLSISELVESAQDESVKYMYGDYVKPTLSISPDAGIYGEPQLVILSSDTDGAIYYTIDGSEPDENSLVYKGPIEVNAGDEYDIRAICISEYGIKSEVLKSNYLVEIAEIEKPVVNTLGGQYTTPTDIKVEVPESLKCYYTVDNSDPTEESLLYEGPIAMYIGTHVFRFACFDDKGNRSEVETVEYTLDIVNFVDMGTAVNNLKLLLEANGKLADNVTLKCEQAEVIDGSIYYLVNEYVSKEYEDLDTLESGMIDTKTGTIYAVEVLTGLTFRVNHNKTSGSFALSAL